MDPRDSESSRILESLLRDKNHVKVQKIDETPQGLVNKKMNEKLINKRSNDLVNEGKKYVLKNNFKDGIDCFTMAIALCPDNYAYLNYRAIAYKMNGHYKQALEDCDKSWQIKHNVDAYNLKASLLRRQKKYEDALDCVQECLEIEPDNGESIYLHEKISKDKQGRNRAPTYNLEKVTAMRQQEKKSKGRGLGVKAVSKLMISITEENDTFKSFKSPLSMLGATSPRSVKSDDDSGWYEVPLKHKRLNESAVKNTSTTNRVIEKYEWQDLPLEYSRVSKRSERRGAKTVYMKAIDKKAQDSRLKKVCKNVYLTLVGSIQRTFPATASRKQAITVFPDSQGRRQCRQAIQSENSSEMLNLSA